MALSEELLRSVFLEMFGHVLPYAEAGPLPVGWRRSRVDEIKAASDYSCVGGPFGSNLTTSDYVNDGIPVIRGTNLGGKKNLFIDKGFVFVTDTKARELHQNMAYPGDLVFTQRGTLGQVVLIPRSANYPRYVVSQSQMKLTLNEDLVRPAYLHTYFSTDRMQKYIASRALTTGVPHINLGILRSVPVIVPPKHLQDDFECLNDVIGRVGKRQASGAAEAELLFGSLENRAFRGEMDGLKFSTPKRRTTDDQGVA